MTAPDYAIEDHAQAASAGELAELLRATAGRALRLIGTGTRQDRLPAPDRPVVAVHCALRAIHRLDREDLTCSVEPGLPLAELDAALAPQGLVAAGIGGAGTVGGALAAGEPPAAAPGAPSPRSVLLGMEGMLADGTAFKTGARVVKSVAGYDLHKLFVGSRGRLFAAAMLHLRLRRRPKAVEHFACRELERDAALVRWAALRRASETPAAAWLARDGRGAFAVHGHVAGSAATVRAFLRRHELAAAAPQPDDLAGAAGMEVVAGLVRPSRLHALLDALPADAPLLAASSGFFAVRTTPAASDALLARCAAVPARAWIRSGVPSRRGIGTPIDPAAERIARALMGAFDPAGRLR